MPQRIYNRARLLKSGSGVAMLAIVLSGSKPASASMYAFQDLGVISGDSDSSGIGINSNTNVEVVGQSGTQAAFSTGGGNLRAFGTSSGPDGGGAADGVNTGGIAVGYYTTAGGNQLGFYSNTAGSSPALNPLPTFGANNGIATAVNGNAAAYEIVGQSEYTNTALHAFAFKNGATSLIPLDPSSTSTGIGGSGVGASSIANGLNATGQIVGQATSGSSVSSSHAFLYDPSTGNPSHAKMYDLGTENGATGTSIANAINSSGVIVGSSDTPDGYSRAFIYSGYNLLTAYGTSADQSLNGTFTDLNAFDHTNSAASAINDSGVVVGESSYTDSLGDVSQHAFVYQSTTGLSDLNSDVTIGSASMDLPTGWTLDSATGINAAGDITGFADDGAGDTYAFLLTPTSVPEPASTGLILMAGTVATLVTRRRRLGR